MMPANAGRETANESGPFLCKICSKAFTKRTSRNRHVLYCQKKLGANQPVLRKSCAACRKAKAKCDSGLPICRRCDEKDVVCVYELSRPSANSAKQAASAPDNQTSHATPIVEFPASGNQDEVFWDLTPEYTNGVLISSNAHSSTPWTGPVQDFPYQNDLVLNWEPDAGFVEDLENSDLGAGQSTNDLSNTKSAFDFFLSSPPRSLTLDPTFSTPPDCMFHTPYLVLRPMDHDYPPRSSTLVSPRSPFNHAHLSIGSQIGRSFLLQNLQSYATLLATSTLPPFIHSTSLPFPEPDQSQIPTCATPPSQPILEICKSIISLYTTKTPATSSFIWRTITVEKDRFMNEYLESNEWELLGMLQAITLYILLRIFDEDSFSVDFDRELVRTMTEIAIKAEQFKLVCHAEVEGQRPHWQEWVLLESKRRTVTLLFILHLMFDIKPEQRAKSKVGLTVLPLPAHKSLWEAKTEDEWIVKYDEMLRLREGRGYLRYLDLMELGKGNGGERMKDLNAWMVSGDAFGILVMMAATTL